MVDASMARQKIRGYMLEELDRGACRCFVVEETLMKGDLRFGDLWCLDLRPFWMPGFFYNVREQGRASCSPCLAPLLPWRGYLKPFDPRAEI